MKKYTTYKTPAIILTFVAIFAWGMQLVSSPTGFKIDFAVLTLGALLVVILLDLLYGRYIVLKDDIVIYTESFLFKKVIPTSEIEEVRYQPTYGIVKEASSLYIFRKGQGTAVFTMASIWYGEKTLNVFLNDLKKVDPKVVFDKEAQALKEREDDYFETRKVRVIPLTFGIGGAIIGILLFIKFQSLNSEEFSLTNHGLISSSAGLIAGFGTYTLIRRGWTSVLVGCIAALVLLGVYLVASD